MRKAARSWRLAMMRTVEDCHSCIVEYEDLQYTDLKDISEHEKAEMRSLMITLLDRVYSTFTSEVPSEILGQKPQIAINDNVLVTMASIHKGRRLLG